MKSHTIIIVYLLIINIIAFILFGIDKYKSTHNRWRVPEVSLLLTAALCGSIGALTGMKVWRHKTQHKSVPAILLLQITLIAARAYLSRG